jgi:hypothetical protein
MARKRPAAHNTERNLQRSVGAARTLTIAVSGVENSMAGAAGAAGFLAENIAKASTNAKIASGALGIGAIVTIGISLVQIWKAATDQMKAFNAQMNQVGGDTKVAQLSGISYAKDLKAQHEQILNAADKELALAEKIDNVQEREAYKAAIYTRTREQGLALDRETVRQRNLSFRFLQLELAAAVELNALKIVNARYTGTQQYRGMVGAKEIELQKKSELASFDEMAGKAHYTEEQARRGRELIQRKYEQQLDLLRISLDEEAQKVGDSFTESLVGSIADGIATAVQSGNITDGFAALTGGILIGLGDMMQTVGKESLVAAKLMLAIVQALKAFAPEGAIVPALMLIAAGGILKGLGASMGGRGGTGGGAG